MSEYLGDHHGEPSDELYEILEIGGQEVLVTERIVSLHFYESAYSRYDHLRVYPNDETILLYFPAERLEFNQWVGRVAQTLSAKPTDLVREEYWQSIPLDEIDDDADLAERETVMRQIADREIAATDIDVALAAILGEA